MPVEDQFDAFSYDTHVLDFGDGRNLNNMIVSNQSGWEGSFGSAGVVFMLP